MVLSGTDENLAEFKTQMPRALADKVVGQINLDMNASPADAWERADEVAQLAQKQQESDLLEQVITLAHKGGAGALGLADTLAGAAARPRPPAVGRSNAAAGRAPVHPLPCDRDR